MSRTITALANDYAQMHQDLDAWSQVLTQQAHQLGYVQPVDAKESGRELRLHCAPSTSSPLAVATEGSTHAPENALGRSLTSLRRFDVYQVLATYAIIVFTRKTETTTRNARYPQIDRLPRIT